MLRPSLAIEPSGQLASRENKELAIQLLRDVEILLKGCLKRSVHENDLVIIRKLIWALRHRLLKARESEVARYVGPELYQWYFEGLRLLKRKWFQSFHNHALRVGNVLFLRLLANPVRDASPSCSLLLDEGYLRFPQIERSVKFSGSHVKRVRAVAENGKVVFEALGYHKSVGRSVLLARMEGSPYSKGARIAGTPIYLKQSGRDLHHMLAVLSRETRSVFHEPIRIRPISPRVFLGDGRRKRMLRTIRDALKMIRRVSSEFYEEAVSVTHAISLVQGPWLVGGSDVTFHGVCVLNPGPAWTAMTYADHIVHEAAHQVLHTKHELSPLLVNCHEMGHPSPIRTDRRPLYGTFHATFVFYRLCLFFDKVLERTHSQEALFRFHRHLLGFYEGMETLERHARFTPAGRRFFKRMIEERNRFKSKISRPDPNAYNRIGRDYSI